MKFEKGTIAILDRSPYGLEYVTVSRVTKTMIKIAEYPMVFEVSDGSLKDRSWYGSFRPSLRERSLELDRRILVQNAKETARQIGMRQPDQFGGLTDPD